MAEEATLPSKVLVVDSDLAYCRTIENSLAKYKINVASATDGSTAVYRFNHDIFDVALVEMNFHARSGLALIQKWREHESIERRSTGFINVYSHVRQAGQENLIRELGDILNTHKPIAMGVLISLLAKAKLIRDQNLKYYELKNNILSFFDKSKDIDKTAELIKKKFPNLGVKGLELLYDFYEKAGKWEYAWDVVAKLVQEKPEDLSTVNLAGKVLMHKKDYALAKTYLEKADSLAPLNIERLMNLGKVYTNLKQPDDAVKKFKEANQLTFDEASPKLDALDYLMDHGFEEHGKKFCHETTAPIEIVRHFNNKGVLCSRSGEYETALQEYNRALKFYPKFKENYRIHFNIALGHLNKKTKEDQEIAIENLKTCLALSPEFQKAKDLLDTLVR